MARPGRKPDVSDDEILDVFRNATDPVLTTREISEEISIGHRGTLDRLRQLADEGKIEMKKTERTGAVWWHPESLRSKYGTVPRPPGDEDQ